jgi:predicted nucleic acid-binding protein
METIYIETTIIGHLTGKLIADPIVSARQQLTRVWWQSHSSFYQLFVSQLVLDECSAGNVEAATERMYAIRDLDLLEGTPATDALAARLIAENAIPATEPRDAFHIAISATNGIKYLLTWNFKHIANASLRTKIELVCRDAGFEPPIICTPDELLGVANDT